jgi:hypothetical protein
MIDVIYELVDPEEAMWNVFTIDNDMTMLNTKIVDGKVVFPSGWNDYWKVSTKAPGANLYNTRMSIVNYHKIVSQELSSINILISGYPEDDIESMLISKETEFKHLIWEDLTLDYIEVPFSSPKDATTSTDVRIAPTKEAFKRYRELYPEKITWKDEDGNELEFTRGKFSSH